MYGNNNIKLVYENGVVIEHSLSNEALNVIMRLSTKSILYSNLAFMLSLIVKNDKIGMLIPTILILFEDTIGSFTNRFTAAKLLPYKYLRILSEITYHKTGEIIIAIVYIYATLCLFYFFRGEI